MLFIIISVLHVSGGFSAHHQELIKTLCAAVGIVMLSCCLPLVWLGLPLMWMGSNPTTSAVDSREA